MAALVLAVTLWAGPVSAGLSCPTSLSALIWRGPLSAFRLLRGTARLSDLNAKFEFAPLAKIGLEVMTKYDPNAYVFVGLGRSPFPVTSFVNLVSPGSAATVPLSYNEHVPWNKRLFPYASKKVAQVPYSWGRTFEYDQSKDEKGFDKVTRRWTPKPHLRENVFALLDRYFPDPKTLQGRKVVLVDFADYGSSLAKFYADVEAWKKERGHSFEVEVLFLQQRPHEPGSYWGDGKWEKELFDDAGVPVPKYSAIPLSGHSELRRLFDAEAFKPFAPYSHVIPTDPKLEKPIELPLNSKFREFEQAMRNDFDEGMAKDPELRRQVEGLRP